MPVPKRVSNTTYRWTRHPGSRRTAIFWQLACNRIWSVRSGTKSGNKLPNSACCLRIVELKAHRNLQQSKFLSTKLLTDHAVAEARRGRAAQHGALNIRLLRGFKSPCVRACTGRRVGKRDREYSAAVETSPQSCEITGILTSDPRPVTGGPGPRARARDPGLSLQQCLAQA